MKKIIYIITTLTILASSQLHADIDGLAKALRAALGQPEGATIDTLLDKNFADARTHIEGGYRKEAAASISGLQAMFKTHIGSIKKLEDEKRTLISDATDMESAAKIYKYQADRNKVFTWIAFGGGILTALGAVWAYNKYYKHNELDDDDIDDDDDE